MKSVLRVIIVFLVISLLIFGVLYPGLMFLAGKLLPDEAAGNPIYKNEQLIGFENIGQHFYSNEYFWGRPSAVDYDASATGGSNKAPTNPEYLATMESRIDSLLKYHPGKEVADIPIELVTASGSGLDPHITKEGALFQVQRVAKARNLSEEEITALVEKYTKGPFLGLFGPTGQVNVLKLNLALDEN